MVSYLLVCYMCVCLIFTGLLYVRCLSVFTGLLHYMCVVYCIYWSVSCVWSLVFTGVLHMHGLLYLVVCYSAWSLLCTGVLPVCVVSCIYWSATLPKIIFLYKKIFRETRIVS